MNASGKKNFYCLINNKIILNPGGGITGAGRIDVTTVNVSNLTSIDNLLIAAYIRSSANIITGSNGLIFSNADAKLCNLMFHSLLIKY